MTEPQSTDRFTWRRRRAAGPHAALYLAAARSESPDKAPFAVMYLGSRCGGTVDQREAHNKRTPSPELTLDRDLAAVRLDDPLGDRQPEARPAIRSRAGWISAVKALEQVRHVLGSDPNPGVLDTQFRPAGLVGHGHQDLPACERIAQSIVN